MSKIKILGSPDYCDLRGTWFGEDDIWQCKVHEAVFEVFRGTLLNYFDQLDSDLIQRQYTLRSVLLTSIQ